MSRRRVTVAGESVLLNCLPLRGETKAWERFITSDPIGVYGLDIETTAAEQVNVLAADTKCRLVQFGTAVEGWALDPHDAYWRGAIKEFASGPDRFVSHTNYDVLGLRRMGVDLADRAIDLIVMANLNDPGEYNDHSLKGITARDIDSGLKNAETALHARFKELAPIGFRVGRKMLRWGFTNIPLDDPIFTAYAALDAVYVRRELTIQNNKMFARMKPLARREQHINRLSNDMQWRGMLLDRGYTEDLLAEFDREYEVPESRWLELMPMKARSYQRRAQWFLDRGMEFTKFTDTGAPEISKDTLPDLIARYGDDDVFGEPLRLLQSMSELQNIRTNLGICLEQADRHNVVHPSINTCQAVTGRMSVTRPAMQTFKKHDPRLRSCFIARPGCVFVGADYDSQEIRLAAAYSRDPAYLKIVFEGLNQHDVTATSIFGAEFTGPQRDQAKILNFLQQYGGGPVAIGNKLGIAPRGVNPQNGRVIAGKRAYRLWEKWREAYPGLVAWTEKMAEYPYVVNPWGRVIPRDRMRPYANGNYMIQSSGRDLLGDATVKLDNAGWGGYLWLWVHDEIILEVPEHLADAASQALVDAMTTEVKGVPLTATPKVLGKRWSGE